MNVCCAIYCLAPPTAKGRFETVVDGKEPLVTGGTAWIDVAWGSEHEPAITSYIRC